MKSLPSPLLIVSDRSLCPVPLEEQVEKLFAAGARWLWFRDKDLPFDERRVLALKLKMIAGNYHGTFSVGGDLALAEDINASAVHVSTPEQIGEARRRLGQNVLAGMSAHSGQDARNASKAGADYVTLSPIYLTSSKPGYGPALGTAAISEAAQTGLPVIALGGVSTDRLGEIRAAGAAGAAMMGAAMQTPEPDAFVRANLSAWK